jgi:hypothetical protein
MLQCITLGSSSTENDGDESEDGINLNITARVRPICINRIFYSRDNIGIRYIIKLIFNGKKLF